MVRDASLLLHILFEEPGRGTRLGDQRRLPYATGDPASLGRAKADPIELLDVLVRGLDLAIAALTAAQAEIARRSYGRFGKGRGCPARLNYGDVMSYALAADRGERLAFVGNDVHHTDADVARLPVGGDASSPE